MTEREQRIALAEAMGWSITKGHLCRGILRVENVGTENATWDDCWDVANCHLPAYGQDMNAVHHARKSLINNRLQIIDFMNQLRTVLGRRDTIIKNKSNTPLVSDYDCMDATADELLEALLKALKLWKTNNKPSTTTCHAQRKRQ